MPLPRYQQLTKRTKVSIEDLDDFILSKIISYVLLYSPKMEKNLSLVSKRWYYLTQSQVSQYGVCMINLQKIIKPSVTFNLYRSLQPKLLKYRHVQIQGTISCDDFRKLLVALNSARVEKLNLSARIERDRTGPRGFASIPREFCHLKQLHLQWTDDAKGRFSNALTWTIFSRAPQLETLEIHLNNSDDTPISAFSLSMTPKTLATPFKSNGTCDGALQSVASIAERYLDREDLLLHPRLSRLIFKRTSISGNDASCCYTSLVQQVVSREINIRNLDTNDKSLIEDLIKSSQRLPTRRELRRLRFSTPIQSSEQLSQLVRLGNLGTDELWIEFEGIDRAEEVRIALDQFKTLRHSDARCHLSFCLKDKKFVDCEDKIKNLVQLCRQADVVVNISSQTRVSIDCCHLMWSVGRALQQSPPTNIENPNWTESGCLFKITLQASNFRSNSFTEITIPFGRLQVGAKVNSQREDPRRHREIMRALKRDCYHQFVKSVRDNVTS